MAFPADQAFIDDEEIAVAEAAVALVDVLRPLNAAVAGLAAHRFDSRIQSEYLRHTSRALHALYSSVPNQWLPKVQALVDGELFPDAPPAEPEEAPSLIVKV